MAEYQPEFQQILFERKGKNEEVLWLTLNNPKMFNSLTDTMQVELTEALEHAVTDNSIRCIVLTGAGDDAFCSGGDIGLLNKLSGGAEGYDYLYKRGNHIQKLLASTDKPVIAAVKGHCYAGGLEICLCCDYIYASSTAKFGLLEINLGVLAGWGGTIRLPRNIAVNRAKEMIYTGEIINAEEAYRIGLVNKIMPTEELLAAVEKTTKAIASKPPLAVRAAKTVINDSITCDSIEAAQTIERGIIMWLSNTEDFKEGTSAFLEKRKPEFKGK